MELGVLSQYYDILIITVDHYCLSGLVARVKLIKKSTELNDLLSDLGLINIFGFTG